jgi:hypothetical protein
MVSEIPLPHVIQETELRIVNQICFEEYSVAQTLKLFISMSIYMALFIETYHLIVKNIYCYSFNLQLWDGLPLLAKVFTI